MRLYKRRCNADIINTNLRPLACAGNTLSVRVSRKNKKTSSAKNLWPGSDIRRATMWTFWSRVLEKATFSESSPGNRRVDRAPFRKNPNPPLKSGHGRNNLSKFHCGERDFSKSPFGLPTEYRVFGLNPWAENIRFKRPTLHRWRLITCFTRYTLCARRPDVKDQHRWEDELRKQALNATAERRYGRVERENIDNKLAWRRSFFQKSNGVARFTRPHIILRKPGEIPI